MAKLIITYGDPKGRVRAGWKIIYLSINFIIVDIYTSLQLFDF